MIPCSQENIIRVLAEKVARNSERCLHLEECTRRIETKLEEVASRIEKKLGEIDEVLNGRSGVPGLVTRVWLMTLLFSAGGTLAFGVLLFTLQRRALTWWLGG